MQENKWFSLADFQQCLTDSNDNPALYLWLADYGSMTSQLKSLTDSDLNVHVLSPDNLVSTESERAFLNLDIDEKPYIREVIMSVEGKSWLYGRTVIPNQTLQGDGEQLMHLGNQPLGKLLFKQEKHCRQFIEVAKITSNHELYPSYDKQLDDFSINKLSQKNQPLWARRSMFSFKDCSLMVQEVFLPNCPLV